jgi:hypothetical protein
MYLPAATIEAIRKESHKREHRWMTRPIGNRVDERGEPSGGGLQGGVRAWFDGSFVGGDDEAGAFVAGGHRRTPVGRLAASGSNGM